MPESARAWRTSFWICFVVCVLVGALCVLLVATAVAIDHTGGCEPPPARVVRLGLLWLTAVVLAAPLPWVVVAVRSPTPGRWVVAALVNLAPAIVLLLAYSASDTHEFFCIPF